MIKEISSIAIVDDCPLVREGIAHAVTRDGQFALTAEGASALDASEIAGRARPDVMLLDLEATGSVLVALREVLKVSPLTKVVILTPSMDHAALLQALRCGAAGYILKGITPCDLRAALMRIAGGEVFVSPEFVTLLLLAVSRGEGASGTRLADCLSDRENDIYGLVSSGLSNKEISRALGIAEKTVKHYMTSIFRKRHVRNRTELAVSFAGQGVTGQGNDRWAKGGSRGATVNRQAAPRADERVAPGDANASSSIPSGQASEVRGAWLRLPLEAAADGLPAADEVMPGDLPAAGDIPFHDPSPAAASGAPMF